jgi:hypothetical protein
MNVNGIGLYPLSSKGIRKVKILYVIGFKATSDLVPDIA